MKAKILHIIALLVMPLLVVSCSTVFDDNGVGAVEDSYITLNLRVPGVSTRGEVEDNEYEAFMSHIDVVIYEYNNKDYSPFYHERVDVSATPDGRATIAKTKRDFKEMGEYRVFVIANSTLDESAYYDGDGSLVDYKTFLTLDQTDNYIHLSGLEFGVSSSIYPQMFLMDGVAYMDATEPSAPGNIIINDPNTDEDVTLRVTLPMTFLFLAAASTSLPRHSSNVVLFSSIVSSLSLFNAQSQTDMKLCQFILFLHDLLKFRQVCHRPVSVIYTVLLNFNNRIIQGFFLFLI